MKRRLVPEVVQTSAMDCGPAALAALLAGFGVHASYGRLREACQTDVDGTSIDTLEEVANQLGLEAEQVMVPLDHVLHPASGSLPALAVTRLPNGFTHFVVVWSGHGRLVQIMDPGAGRRFLGARELLDDLYIHQMPVSAAGWREYAGSEEFLAPLRGRLAALGASSARREGLVREALADAGALSLAALDAATRMVSALVQGGGIDRGTEAAELVSRLAAEAREQPSAGGPVPLGFWTAAPTAPDEEGEPQVSLRGAVLVRVRGRRAKLTAAELASQEEAPAALSPELARALAEPPPRPWLRLGAFLREGGLAPPSALVLGLLLGTGGVMVEALLFRGFLEASTVLRPPEHRLFAIGGLLAFVVVLLFLEIPLTSLTLRLGRALETRLRLAIMRKIPRLPDRYFRSRLTSDMAERAHALRALHTLPSVAAGALRAIFALAATVIGIAWLDPRAAPIALLAAVLSVAVPWASRSLLTERDLRYRAHLAALGTFYLDALRGLVPLRAHGGEQALRREHEGLLVDWERAAMALQRGAVWVNTLSAVLGFALAAGLVAVHVAHAGESGSVLLLVYWSLSVPVHGERLALVTRQYPQLRNVALRLFEPLDAPEDPTAGIEAPASLPELRPSRERGVHLSLRGVTAMAGGHAVLADIDLEVPAGAQVAIVGKSGAGKSTLAGLFLGFHQASAGEIRVDGALLDIAALGTLRQQTAWLDPGVTLWNRSLLDNLRYGAPEAIDELGRVVDDAEIRSLLDRMPEGLQSPLGESGALLSGGEGQRVRLGRSLLRQGVRLALLDEPFRGLDRGARRRLLARVRANLRGATLLCVTHDVEDTRVFDRVLVIEDGRLVEDGNPSELAADPETRYRALLDAEASLRRDLWTTTHFRRLELRDGRLQEEGR